MKPISVIIVNFNAGKFLSDCVRSVLASTVPAEVIVVDNRSTDNSLDILRRDFVGENRLKIIKNEQNLGFAKANNIALPIAKGDYLLFLNPDCLIRPDTLAKMVGLIERHPQIGMAGCLIRNPDGSEQAGCRRAVPTPWRTFVRLTNLYKFSKHHPKLSCFIQTDTPLPADPIEIEAISGAFMLVCRGALEKVGPMDEGYFMHCEDLDWCMRFRQEGFRILFVPTVEILHVGGVCSSSRPALVEYYKHKGMVRFYRKFFRHQYPALLMWLVMLGIGTRCLTRALMRVTKRTKGRAMMSNVSGLCRKPDDFIGEENPKRRIIVTGATSLIGDFLLPALVEAGFKVHAISRKSKMPLIDKNIVWHRQDISKGRLGRTYGADTLIHLAPLWTLPPIIDHMATGSIKRVIAFGSTSVFTKENSGYEKERQMALMLRKAEDGIKALCAKQGIAWTLFRPTMVYSLGRDKNVTTIARFIKRFHFFPLVGAGNGRRQPVHAEDLAIACLNAMDNPKTFDKAYNLSGGEILTYQDMVKRISIHIETKCKIIHIPLSLMRFALSVLSNLPGYQKITPEAANRINMDMCFDNFDAASDINFMPRKFMERQPRAVQCLMLSEFKTYIR